MCVCGFLYSFSPCPVLACPVLSCVLCPVSCVLSCPYLCPVLTYVLSCVLYCVLSFPVSCPVLCPVLSCPVLSSPVLSCSALPCPALPCPALSCPVPVPVLSCLIWRLPVCVVPVFRSPVPTYSDGAPIFEAVWQQTPLPPPLPHLHLTPSCILHLRWSFCIQLRTFHISGTLHHTASLNLWNFKTIQTPDMLFFLSSSYTVRRSKTLGSFFCYFNRFHSICQHVFSQWPHKCPVRIRKINRLLVSRSGLQDYGSTTLLLTPCFWMKFCTLRDKLNVCKLLW